MITPPAVAALILRLLSCACFAYAAVVAVWRGTDRLIERLG